MSKGYVQVYTGAGKGKTTAAIGLAIRALGAGQKVFFLQFMKSLDYSEQKILVTISPNLILETVGKPFFIIKEGSMPAAEQAQWCEQAVVFPPGNPPQEYVDLISNGIKRAKAAVTNGEFDMVILDELIVAMHFELTTWAQIEEIIDARSEKVELVLTGRGATPALIERADLVTEMKEIKHYYRVGVMSRKGIEN
jgi:cob(I)alamin adenosyltransferase